MIQILTSQDVAFTIVGGFYSIFSITGGGYATITSLPVYVRWIARINPIAHTLQMFLRHQVRLGCLGVVVVVFLLWMYTSSNFFPSFS